MKTLRTMIQWVLAEWHRIQMKIIGMLVQQALVWIRRTLPERGKPVPFGAFSGLAAAHPNMVVELVIADKVESPFNGRVLLHRRGGRWKGVWHTIGGWIHAGESAHEACKRHAADLGLQIEVVKEVGQRGKIDWREDLTHPYGWDNNGDLRHEMFLCRVTGSVVETSELRWFKKENVPSPLLRGHKAHVEAYYNLK